ncbi:sulfotransferase family protein [Rhodovulum steppense]|uniref:Sulfotransferase family protein n=1 Tax=Rhodovulum steppense TaxID=540251 RepID=A0A4R1YSM2_9RHOB|nr:sulfotransferase [Rhodovulum steppense]TCM82640.1 sulfotransferase family protein [Rhodovulum steppense]
MIASPPHVPAPIFLICSERSGSNLTSLIMGAHGSVYAHPPYHLGRDLLLNLRDTLAGGIDAPAWPILCERAAAQVARYRGADEAERLRLRLAAQAIVDPAAIARFIWQEMPPEARGKRAFVKENNIHRLLPFLVACFPDAQYVFQVRDPRDFLASAKARGKGMMGNKFGSLREALRVWREDQENGLWALSLLGSERVTLLRYEDLLAAPEPSLRRVCRFLGLPFEPGMLEFHNSEAAARLAVPGGPRENVARPLMQGNFAKYRKILSRGEIQVTEAYLGDLMDRLGYDSDFPRKSRRRPWRALRPMLSEPIERLFNKQLRARYKNDNTRLTDRLDREARPVMPGQGQG